LQAGTYFIKVQFAGYATLKSGLINLSAGQKLNIGCMELSYISSKGYRSAVAEPE
jgi:hypothetical protein